jgi:hypothetical protein
MLVFICWLVPFLAIVIVVSGVMLYSLIHACERSLLELKRETNNAMSPLLTNLTEIQHSRLMIQV